jgi:hypothetical protein
MTNNKPTYRQPQFCVIGYCTCGKCRQIVLLGGPGDFATVSHDARVLQCRHPRVQVTIAIDNRFVRQQRTEFLKRTGITIYPAGSKVTIVETFPGKSPEVKSEQLPPPAEGGAL